MLEKSLGSLLDYKEIKPVNPKGNQPWIFIGRTDAEAETAILWPPDVQRWLSRKDPAADEWIRKLWYIYTVEYYSAIKKNTCESVLHIMWSKDWSFKFNISPSNEHPGLISFRMDWLDLLVVQGTLKSFLQHHSSKASILRCSAFFTVQLSHPYMITGKSIALTRRTFVGKVMSLLFNMLSRLVISFLPRSKQLLIS